MEASAIFNNLRLRKGMVLFVKDPPSSWGVCVLCLKLVSGCFQAAFLTCALLEEKGEEVSAKSEQPVES
jgi:hypothetical protein